MLFSFRLRRRVRIHCQTACWRSVSSTWHVVWVREEPSGEEAEEYCEAALALPDHFRWRLVREALEVRVEVRVLEESRLEAGALGRGDAAEVRAQLSGSSLGRLRILAEHPRRQPGGPADVLAGQQEVRLMATTPFRNTKTNHFHTSGGWAVMA